MPPLAFNEIPINVRVPGSYIEFDNSRAVQGLPVIPHKIMVFGQRLAAGAVAEGVPTRILSPAEGEAAFGRGAMLTAIINAIKVVNPYTELWAVALDDAGAGVPATGQLTVTGPATEAGTLNLYIAGQRLQIAVADTDTATDIGDAIEAAVTAATDLPVTASNAVGVVTFTCKWDGDTGNDVDLRANYYFGDKTPAGVALAFVAMASGATNPDIATAITAIGDEQYHTFVNPWTDAANLTALEAELLSRWGPLKMIEGHVFSAATGTHSTITTLGDSRNSQFQTIIGLQNSPTSTWEAAAIVAGVDAGETDPARPRQTLPLTGILAPTETDRYTFAERNLHLQDGVSTFIVDSGGNVLVERLITTYQENSGVPDTSYLDVTTMRTLAYLRFSLRARIALRYPRFKLADDGTRIGAGQKIVTPARLSEELVALAREWEIAGLVENVDQFKSDLLVERDSDDPNRVNAIIPPDIINQFRVFAAQIQFLV